MKKGLFRKGKQIHSFLSRIPLQHTTGISLVTIVAISLIVTTLSSSPAHSVASAQTDPTTLPRIQQSDISYLGSFTVPRTDSAGNPLIYGGHALGYNPVNHSLFFGCHDWYQRLAEVSIPSFGGTATILQNCTDVTDGKLGTLGTGNTKLGGNFVYNNRLITTAYLYYDAGNAQTQSHGVGNLNLSINDFNGFFPFSGATAPPRALAGYMTLIPTEWRSLFGGPALTGQGGLSIVSNSSDGPAATVFDPDEVGVGASIPGTTVLYYNSSLYRHPDFSGKGSVLGGIAFPNGSRTVIFFGKRAQLPYCYDNVNGCPGRCSSGISGPANTFKHAFWLYDANDLLKVKNGQLEPYEVREYATIEVSDITTGDCANVNYGGATFDQATGILYMTPTFGSSNPIVHAFQIGTPTSDTTPPTSPTNLAANATSQSSITVSWNASTDNQGVTGYIVERCQGSGCSNFIQVGTPTASPFVDSGLTANTFYNYHVRATDGAGNLSGWSNVVGATTLALDTTPPTAPTNLIATAQSSNQINLSWTASTDANGVTGYKVERCQGVSCTTFAQIATPSGTSYSDTSGLSANTIYRYRVRANDAAGNDSLYSNIAEDTTQAPPPDITTGLVAHYNFDENTGTVANDTGGNNNDGTLTNGPTWTTGKISSGIQFDGTNDRVDLSTLDVSGSAITLSAWIKADSFTNCAFTDCRIISKAVGLTEANHYWMVSTINSSGTKLRFRLKTGGTTSTLIANTGTLTTNTWTHVLAWYDGSQMKLYKDGVEVGSTAKTGSITTNSSAMSWIADNPPTAGSQPFDGAIDDVRIYNRALSATEIQALYSYSGGDTTDPTISLTSPTDGAIVSGTSVAVSADASDNVGVAGVQFQLDGINLGTEDTASPYETTWETTTATDGTHTLTAIARDAAGNQTTSSGVSVTVDNQAPTVPANLTATAASPSQIYLSWDASADNVGVVGYYVSRDGIQIANVTTGTAYSDSGGLDASTPYSYTVSAYDAQGNISWPSSPVSVTTSAVIPDLPDFPSYCHRITDSSNMLATDDFAVPYDLFSAAVRVLMNVFCGTTVDVVVGDGSSYTYIYQHGYSYINNQWVQHTYQGNQKVAGEWFVGSAMASLDAAQYDLAQDNYVVAHICQWTDSGWKCGCQDTACSPSRWNIQKFRQ